MSPEQDPFDKILDQQRAEIEIERAAAVDRERRNGLRYLQIKEHGRALAEMLKPTLDRSVRALQATGLPSLDQLQAQNIKRQLEFVKEKARDNRFNTISSRIAVPVLGSVGLEGIVVISYKKGLMSHDERVEPVGWQVAKGPSDEFVSTVQKEFSPRFPIRSEGDGPDARNGGSYDLLASTCKNELLWARLEIPAHGSESVVLTERARKHGITEYPGFIEHTEHTPELGGYYEQSEKYETYKEGLASLYAGAIEAITGYLAKR